MDSKIAEQMLDELAPTFEAIESRSDAILKFLKDKNLATEDQLAPYLEQAAAASSVKWRALRVRMGRLLALAEKSDEEHMAKEAAKQIQDEKAASDKQAQANAKKSLEQGAKSGNDRAAEATSGTERGEGAEQQKEPEPVAKDTRAKEDSDSQSPGKHGPEPASPQSSTNQGQANPEPKKTPQTFDKRAA